WVNPATTSQVQRSACSGFWSDGVGVEVARRICAECPSKEPCLEYALHNKIEHGVWGGASERERRRIARRRRVEHSRVE
ncbi:MAG: WhiB family transcriptional regulator, partial [Acidimicrobiales bacterium]